MKLLACIVLNLLLLAGAFADPVFEIAKIYPTPGANTREMMFTRLKNPLRLFVDRTPAITDKDVAEALLLDEKDPGVRVTLTNEGFEKFDQLVKDSIPGRLAVIIEGEVNRILYISKVEHIGAFPVYGNWTPDEAKRIVAALRASRIR
jgi:preprotein translocase subunit SecD